MLEQAQCPEGTEIPHGLLNVLSPNFTIRIYKSSKKIRVQGCCFVFLSLFKMAKSST